MTVKLARFIFNSMKLDELAAKAGVSPRTVRYYVQRGLLPAPVFRGKDTAYDDEHLARLRAIKKLQDQFLPLDAIEIELKRRSVYDIENEPPRTQVLREPMSPYRVADEPVTTWRRYELAPGVELHVASDADARARELADNILKTGGKK